jgi:hypothetical protein
VIKSLSFKSFRQTSLMSCLLLGGILGSSTQGLAEDSTPAKPAKNMNEYCGKYKNSLECKPHDVKDQLKSIKALEDKAAEKLLKDTNVDDN